MTKHALNEWLNWQLKHGSHEFPGPNGGTCINEAAAVVAGLGYREVTGISDLPESFCPVISQYALTLNDAMPEGELLNRLRPFALRLAGSADGRKVAVARAAYLAQQAAQVLAPMALDRVDAEAARQLRTAADAEAACALLDDLTKRALPGNVRKAIGAAHRALNRALDGRDAIYAAELVAVSAARTAAVEPQAWDQAIEVLEGVLAIGKQADPAETTLIEQRAADVLAAA